MLQNSDKLVITACSVSGSYCRNFAVIIKSFCISVEFISINIRANDGRFCSSPVQLYVHDVNDNVNFNTAMSWRMLAQSSTLPAFSRDVLGLQLGLDILGSWPRFLWFSYVPPRRS